MHLDRLHRPVRDDPDSVPSHRVPSSPLPLQVLDMPRRVDELEPPGDPEQHGPVVAGGGPGSATIAIGVTLIPLDRRVRLWNR